MFYWLSMAPHSLAPLLPYLTTSLTIQQPLLMESSWGIWGEIKWLNLHMGTSPQIRKDHPGVGMWRLSSEAAFEGELNKSSPTKIKALQLLGIRERHSKSLVPSLMSRLSTDKAYTANIREVENTNSTAMNVLRKRGIQVMQVSIISFFLKEFLLTLKQSCQWLN